MITIKTSDLEVACEVSGPLDGPVILLLHGWPDDATTWDRLVAHFTRAGYRTVVPSLRGFGKTRFLSEATLRTADPGIMAMDAIALMDALDIERFIAIGHDWGSNIAEALAVGWPTRVERLGMLGTSPRLGGLPTPPLDRADVNWYQWFMATPRGEQAVRDDRRGFAHVLWQKWGPPGWFDEATFSRVAASWDNADWASVTLHSYQSRWGVAPPDPRSAWLVSKVAETQVLSLPTIIVQGDADGVAPPVALKNIREKFNGAFEFVRLLGVGHFPQRESADTLAALLLSFLRSAVPSSDSRTSEA